MEKLVNLLEGFKKAGYQFKTVYDIGAHIGMWSSLINRFALPETEFILFEANPSYRDILSKTAYKSFCGQVLTFPDQKTVRFYNGSNTGDSYYKETTTYYDNQSYIELPGITLDELIKTHNLPIPNFIKLDTQGSELDILDGADSIIDKVDFILTELPIICYNKGAPNIADYLNYFRERQFLPFDIIESHRAENILIQMDILFVRSEFKEKFIQPTINIRPWTKNDIYTC